MSWLSVLIDKLRGRKQYGSSSTVVVGVNPTPPTTVTPLDRRPYDSPVRNQEDDGLPEACSVYATFSAMTQMLLGRVIFDLAAHRAAWALMGGPNLTGALNAIARLPGMQTGGIKGSDGKIYSIERYMTWDGVAEPEVWIQAAFLANHSVVIELKESPELNGDGYTVVYPSLYLGGTHAVCVSDILPDAIVIKNSFGAEHGDHGYQTLPNKTLRPSLYAMYSIVDLKAVA